MTIVPVDKKTVLECYKSSKWQRLFEEFIATGCDAARIEGHEDKNLHNVANIANRSAKRYGFRVRVIVRSGKLYLIKED